MRVDHNSGFIYFPPEKAGPILGEQMGHLDTLAVEVRKEGVESIAVTDGRAAYVPPAPLLR